MQHWFGNSIIETTKNGELKPIAFASRYLNSAEKKYSVGKLELLAIVWSLERTILMSPVRRTNPIILSPPSLETFTGKKQNEQTLQRPTNTMTRQNKLF